MTLDQYEYTNCNYLSHITIISMTTAKTLKLVTAISETILAIPIYGWLLVISLLWTPLIILLVLHITTLVIGNEEWGIPKWGSISGIITSLLWWVPFLGMALHILTAILLWIDFSRIKSHVGSEETVVTIEK